MMRICSLIVKPFDMLFRQVVLRMLAYLMPRDKSLVAVGAWGGKTYGDNPKYFVEHLLKNTDMRIVWIGQLQIKEEVPAGPRLQFVGMGTWTARWALLRAGTWICCQSVAYDLTGEPLWGHAKLINFWHGIGPKLMGKDTPYEKRHPKPKVSGLRQRYSMFTRSPRPWTVISSDGLGQVLASGEPENFDPKKFLRAGSPRNDFLVNNKVNKDLITELKEKYAKLIGFDATKKLVIYLPTWRKDGSDVFAFYRADDAFQKSVSAMLSENNAVLVEKHHPHTLEKYDASGANGCSIVVSNAASRKIDTQELLLCADVLITDYSSAYVDYALLQRQIIHFAYDLDSYTENDTGFSAPFETIAGGPIVQTRDKMVQVLSEALARPGFRPGNALSKMLEFEKGAACRQTVDFIRDRK